MSNYRWAPGHDVAYDALIFVDPQPHSPGMKAAERTYGLSGSVFEQAPYDEWIFELLEDTEDYQALLAQINLDDSLTGPITIWTEDETFAYARFNATVARPQIGTEGQREQMFARGFVFVFTRLERLS